MKSSTLLGFATTGFVSHVAASTSGSLSVVTMNVAGLPDVLQGNDVPGNKETNSRLIGAKFAEYNYDIINVQEVFLPTTLNPSNC